MLQNFIRDDHSGAAVNNNVAELHKYRNKRQKNVETEQRLKNIESSIKNMTVSINNINAVIMGMLK